MKVTPRNLWKAVALEMNIVGLPRTRVAVAARDLEEPSSYPSATPLRGGRREGFDASSYSNSKPTFRGARKPQGGKGTKE